MFRERHVGAGGIATWELRRPEYTFEMLCGDIMLTDLGISVGSGCFIFHIYEGFSHILIDDSLSQLAVKLLSAH